MKKPLLTADIKDLVTEALDSLPRPLTEDVTDRVLAKGEKNPDDPFDTKLIHTVRGVGYLLPRSDSA